MQPRLQPEKNIVPAPLSPDMQGSSQLCSIIFDTEKSDGELHKPSFSEFLDMPQRRGQIVHWLMNSPSHSLFLPIIQQKYGNYNMILSISEKKRNFIVKFLINP